VLFWAVVLGCALFWVAVAGELLAPIGTGVVSALRPWPRGIGRICLVDADVSPRSFV
jgi:hypothetical protein